MFPRNIFSVRVPGVKTLPPRPSSSNIGPSFPASVPQISRFDRDKSLGAQDVFIETQVLQKEQVPVDVARSKEIERPEEFGRTPESSAQLPYRPLSRIPAGGALTPRALAAGSEKALAALSKKHPDPDGWLCERLGWSKEDLQSRLTAEQVDAVMLALEATDVGEGFILADTTGFGKGRILWASAVGLLRRGDRVIFLTETENLFSDAWRDIRHIGAESLVGRPFILNSGATIVDLNDPEIPPPFPVWKRAEVQSVLTSGELPPEMRVVFATYSQFNRLASKKGEWLRKISGRCHLLLDEAHNMVGRGSNTNRLFREILECAKSTIFSSATFSRDLSNTAVYASVFSWLKPLLRQAGREVDKEEIPPLVRRCLAQESVRLAVERGRLVRREIDMSGVALEFHCDAARLPEREKFADAAASVFAAMTRVSAIARRAAERMNGQAAAEEPGQGRPRSRKAGLWNAVPLGMVLASLIDQMEAALLVEDAIKDASLALRRGEKPVLVIEHTLETFLRELHEGIDMDEEEVCPDLLSQAPEVVPESFASFGDACRLAAMRLATLTRRVVGTKECERLVLDTKEIKAALDRVDEAIGNLPILSLSPIDDIRLALEREGWRVREISGRRSRVENGRLVPLDGDDRNQAIAGFNHGDVDALILTRAGATGLSLHDSIEFRDRKRRRMIFLRMLLSPVKMVQMIGRVYRRGQVSVPSFVVLSCGLPSEIYGFAMQRRKLEELSLAVTGQPRSVAALDVPDPFNALGERITREILADRPDVADRLGISDEMEEDGNASSRDDTWAVKRFFRRIPVLPVATQKRLLESFFESYRERLDAGDDPDGTEASLDGSWRLDSTLLLHAGDGTDCPVLGRPVMIGSLVGHRSVEPLRSQAVLGMIANSGVKSEDLKARSEIIASYRQRALLVAAGDDLFRLKKFLSSSKPNRVKTLNQRLSAMMHLLRTVRPGIGAQLPDAEGRGREALVLDVLLAPEARALSARDYRIIYAIPGEVKPRRLGFDAILASSVCLFWDERHGRRVLESFDSIARGRIVERRMVLFGSLPRAAMEAIRLQVGVRSRVSWRDEDGNVLSGFLLPKDAETMARSLPLGVSDPTLVAALLARGATLWTSPTIHEGGALLRPERRGVFFIWPDNRREAMALVESGLTWVEREYPNGFVPSQALDRLCSSVVAAAGSLYCDSKWRMEMERHIQCTTVESLFDDTADLGLQV